jgi:hypothetical protein
MSVLLGYQLPVVIVKDDKICHGEPSAAQPNARKAHCLRVQVAP